MEVAGRTSRDVTLTDTMLTWPSEVGRAVAAAASMAMSLGLRVDEAIPVHASNRVAVRLRPAGTLARVASRGDSAAQFEIDLAMQLARTDSPVAGLDPRVTPRVHERDDFAITLWTYHETVSPQLQPVEYAAALSRLHTGMRELAIPTPHFRDRVDQARAIVANPGRSPDITTADRDLLSTTLRHLERSIAERGAPEQHLHGEPHPGNVLNTAHGPLFIDLETCCRGPIEFDLAHVPEDVSARYPGVVDRRLLIECRILVLAMVAAWRFDVNDQFPAGQAPGRELVKALRHGPPYPTLDSVMGPHEAHQVRFADAD